MKMMNASYATSSVVIKLSEYEKIKTYVFSTAPIFTPEIKSILYSFTLELGNSSLKSVKALVVLIIYFLIIGCKVTVIIFPYIIAITYNIIEFHKTQLSLRELLGEFIFIFCCVLYYINRRYIIKTTKRIQAYISSKSKAAARIAPHCLLFASTISISILFQKFLVHLSSSYVLPVFTLVIPVLSTMRLLNRSSSDLSLSNMYTTYCHVLELWILLAIYHTTASLGAILPYSTTYLFKKTLFLRQFIVVICFWIQLSPSLTEIVLDLAEPLKRVMTLIPSLQIDANQSKGVFYTMRMFGLIRQHHETFLISLFQDGMALFFTLLFVFTPFPTIGVVIVALLFPAFKSLRSIDLYTQITYDTSIIATSYRAESIATSVSSNNLSSSANGSSSSHSSASDKMTSKSLSSKRDDSSWQIVPSSSSSNNNNGNGRSSDISTGDVKSFSTAVVNKDKSKTSNIYTSKSKQDKEKERKKYIEDLLSIQIECKRWIEYWLCLGCLYLIHIYSIKIWSSLFMILTLWLQHSYFQGASRTIHFVDGVISVLIHRNQKLRDEINLKKQQQQAQMAQQQASTQNTEGEVIIEADAELIHTSHSDNNQSSTVEFATDASFVPESLRATMTFQINKNNNNSNSNNNDIHVENHTSPLKTTNNGGKHTNSSRPFSEETATNNNNNNNNNNNTVSPSMTNKNSNKKTQ